MAYILGSDFELWSNKADGSDGQRLTFPPMLAFGAHFSPDGRQIAFEAGGAGVPAGIYVVPVEAGGKPEQILAQKLGGLVGWPPDGRSLIVWQPKETGGAFLLNAVNLNTRGVTVLPGSEGLHHGSLSPDGRHVAGLSERDKSVVLYDLQTHQQTELAKGAAVIEPHWSHDGREVFFQDVLEGSDQPIYRVRIDDHRVERVTNFAQPLAADVTGYRLAGVTPEDAVLAMIIRSNSDLYALDVDFP